MTAELTLCIHCGRPIEKKEYLNTWLHADGYLYCNSNPLSKRATPAEEAK